MRLRLDNFTAGDALLVVSAALSVMFGALSVWMVAGA